MGLSKLSETQGDEGDQIDRYGIPISRRTWRPKYSGTDKIIAAPHAVRCWQCLEINKAYKNCDHGLERSTKRTANCHHLVD
jgi:hypothetical protein